MGSGRDRRAAAAADRAAAEEALRRGIDEVLRVKDEGDWNRASNLALALVDAHPKSAAPYNLLGLVMESAAANLQDQLDGFPAQHPDMVSSGDAALIEEDRARRAKERAGALSELKVYLQACAEWYGKAAQLAPRCVLTRTSYARSLDVTGQSAAAYKEFDNAMRIGSPDTPQKNNPWEPSKDHATDQERKVSALARARSDFAYFLHHADRRVYLACSEILLSVRNGQGITSKETKEATVLAADYPFSARANLIGPFLKRSLIEASTNSIPKLKRYQQLLHDIADTMDLFPSSVVITLFRAELLYSMGRYLEASSECIRALHISRPDDPVSQDVPPGWASGSGPTARIASAMDKVMDLLERIEEELSDPADIEKLLHKLHLESKDGLPTNNTGKRLVDNLKSKQLQSVLNKAAEPDTVEQKGKRETHQVPAKKYKYQIHNRNKNEGVLPKEDATEHLKLKENVERPRPQQVLPDRVVPRHTVDAYAEFCYLRSVCSRKKEVCHLCVFLQRQYTTMYPRGDMNFHCLNIHKTKTIECAEVDTCATRFTTMEDKELHQYYCHVLDKDWWIKWRHW